MSSGTVDAQPPPISSGRPANVVAQAVCAWPTRVAITCGCFMITSSRGSGSLSRIGAIRPRPMSAGGWCRETNAGLSSEPSCSSSQASWSRESSPWSIRLPSRAGTSESSIRIRKSSASSTWTSGPGTISTSSMPRANASRTSWLPVPTSLGPGQASRTARASAYSSGSPWSAMSPETRSTSGRGSSASRCATTASARARASGGPPKWVSLTWAMSVIIRAPGRRTRASAGRRA